MGRVAIFCLRIVKILEAAFAEIGLSLERLRGFEIGRLPASYSEPGTKLRLGGDGSEVNFKTVSKTESQEDALFCRLSSPGGPALKYRYLSTNRYR